jgi:uncharacterized protein YkwD
MRSVAWFVTIIFIAALSGCGSGGSSTATNGAKNDNSGSVAAGPDDTGASNSSVTGIDDIRENMLAAINQARSADRMCGSDNYSATTPVSWNDKIASAAIRQSSDTAANDFLSHTGSDNSLPGDRLTQEGYQWSTYGENIAVGYSSVTAVVQGWLNSEGHCRNIMNPAFDEIGAAYSVGYYQGSPSMTYWTLDLASSR